MASTVPTFRHAEQLTTRQCPECLQAIGNFNEWRKHFQYAHPHIQDSARLWNNISTNTNTSINVDAKRDTSQQPPLSQERPGQAQGPLTACQVSPEPGTSLPQNSLKRAPSTSPRPRSRVRPEEATRPPHTSKSRATWTPEGDGGHPPSEAPKSTPHLADATMIRQPETRPISQEQLVAEVKGIYAGLVMVESKCIEVDNSQSQGGSKTLKDEQWQALIALHRTLLHEHHDFFLASQHPSASPALRRLASKYAMPARMWRHGIHSFLELLRHCLPESLEHMLTFIYLAYSMMALLFETVPAFEDTWIECLGDLGRYRMAIEDDDIRDREVWTGVSRFWYSKASDKAPTTGRLYHHLAILARPNALQQLFYYSKSLCVPIPFKSAKESILTLFDPVLSTDPKQHVRMAPVDIAFVKAMAILFTRRDMNKLKGAIEDFLSNLDTHIARSTRRWQEAGYYIAIVTACSLLGFGLDETDERPNNVLLKAIQPSEDVSMDEATMESEPSKEFNDTLDLASRTQQIVFRRFGDANILQYVHCSLVFMYHMSSHSEAMELIGDRFPWKLTALLLNTLTAESTDLNLASLQADRFPVAEKDSRPLPEDNAMRGLLYVEGYYPSDFFDGQVDDEEKFFELPSMMEIRRKRIIWIGFQLAKRVINLQFDNTSQLFRCHAKFEDDLDMLPLQTERAGSEARTVSSVSTFSVDIPTPSSSEDEYMRDLEDGNVVQNPSSTGQ